MEEEERKAAKFRFRFRLEKQLGETSRLDGNFHLPDC